MSLFTRLQRLVGGRRYRYIIVGVGFDAYQLYEAIVHGRRGAVLFFIDDEPWNHRTRIGTAELRYPAELVPLVERHRIDAVLCADRTLLENVPPATRQRLANVGCPVLVKDDEAPLTTWVDGLPAAIAGGTRNPETI